MVILRMSHTLCIHYTQKGKTLPQLIEKLRHSHEGGNPECLWKDGFPYSRE